MNQLRYFDYLKKQREKQFRQCQRCGETFNGIEGSVCISCCNELHEEEEVHLEDQHQRHCDENKV